MEREDKPNHWNRQGGVIWEFSKSGLGGRMGVSWCQISVREVVKVSGGSRDTDKTKILKKKKMARKEVMGRK